MTNLYSWVKPLAMGNKILISSQETQRRKNQASPQAIVAVVLPQTYSLSESFRI